MCPARSPAELTPTRTCSPRAVGAAPNGVWAKKSAQGAALPGRKHPCQEPAREQERPSPRVLGSRVVAEPQPAGTGALQHSQGLAKAPSPGHRIGRCLLLSSWKPRHGRNKCHSRGDLPRVSMAKQLRGLRCCLQVLPARGSSWALSTFSISSSISPYTQLLLAWACSPAGLPGAAGAAQGERTAQGEGEALSDGLLWAQARLLLLQPCPTITDAGHARAQASGLRRELRALHLATRSPAWAVSLELARPRSHSRPVTSSGAALRAIRQA